MSQEGKGRDLRVTTLGDRVVAETIGPFEAQGTGKPPDDEESIVAEANRHGGHLVSGPNRWVVDKRRETDRSEFRRNPPGLMEGNGEAQDAR